MKNVIENEPVVVSTAITAVVGCAATFGLKITDQQQGAICAVVVALMALLAAFTRSKVTPNARAQAITPEDGSAPTVAGPASPIPTGTPVEVTPAAQAPLPAAPESDETTASDSASTPEGATPITPGPVDVAPADPTWARRAAPESDESAT